MFILCKFLLYTLVDDISTCIGNFVQGKTGGVTHFIPIYSYRIAIFHLLIDSVTINLLDISRKLAMYFIICSLYEQQYHNRLILLSMYIYRNLNTLVDVNVQNQR